MIAGMGRMELIFAQTNGDGMENGCRQAGMEVTFVGDRRGWVFCVPVQVSGLSGEVRQVGWWIQFLSLAKSVTAFVVAIHNCWSLLATRQTDNSCGRYDNCL